MGCDYCTHKAVCSKKDSIGRHMVGVLMTTFPAVNSTTAKAAIYYTMASLCSHYRTEVEDGISITIVSGD